ncbi:MAG: plastocyanin/azurin family copper-binding protein [Candidatus Methylomirabilales bacterium]
MQALLGTRLAADINLVAQIVLLIGLWIGFYYARTRQIPKHANMQTAMVMANLIFIFFVMVPSFYQYVILGGTTGGIVAQLMLLHGFLGLIAQLSGVYLVLRMRTQFLPARFRVRNFKLVMQVTLGLWTIIFVLGIGIYFYRYLVPKPVATVTTSLVKFREAGEVLVGQAEELQAAVIGGDVQAVKGAAEKLVNLIEGKTGAHFGDLDKDGSVQDAGDGIGLLDYVHAVKSAAPNAEISALAGNVERWLTTIRDNALAVIDAKDPSAVEATVEGVVPLAERAQREGVTKIVAGAPPLVIVVMDEFAFNPHKVTIKTGTTVVWINQEPEVHSVTADDGKFDSGDLDRGAVFSIPFREAGTFPYYCIYHGDLGGVDMAGTVIVE